MSEALYTFNINAENGSWGNYTVRTIIPSYYFNKDASRIKIKFKATSHDINLSKVYFGHCASSGDIYDFDGNQVQLLFSSSAALDLTAGNTVYSDEIDFTFDSSKPVILSAWVKSGGSGWINYDNSTGLNSYYKSGDYAGTTDVSSWTHWGTNGTVLVEEIYGVTVGDEEVTESSSYTGTLPHARYDNWANSNVRVIVPAALLSTSGASVRVLFCASEYTQTFRMTRAFIGHQAESGDAYDFDGNQAELLFGGVSGATLQYGGEKWSDSTEFELDETKNLIISYHVYNDAATDTLAVFGGATNAITYYATGSDESGTTNVSSYSQYGTFNGKTAGFLRIVATATSSQVDPEASGGIVMGGQVVEVLTTAGVDPVGSGGIVFGGEEVSAEENHLVDGTCIGGIVFGGEVPEQWEAEPNNFVAVKGGTYRIGGEIYTLAETLSYAGIGAIAALVDCEAAPASPGMYRYDLLSIDAAGTITVTAGTEATTPAMPATPSNEIKLDHVLRYYGQVSIIQSDIGKLWTAPQLASLTVVVADDDLAWAETDTAITVYCWDGNGVAYTGSKTINATFVSGNGTITPLSRSGTAASFTFTYTRNGDDPGDISPYIQFAASTGPLFVTFIKLRDAGGDIMI